MFDHGHGRPSRHQVADLAVMRPAAPGLRLEGTDTTTDGNAGVAAGPGVVLYAARDYAFRRDGTFTTRAVAYGDAGNAGGVSARGGRGRATAPRLRA